MPLYDGPFFTKIVVWISLPIFVSLLTLRLCITAVWRLPCSSSTARSMAASTSGTRTSPSTGIISSCTTNGWVALASHTISRTPGGGVTPMASRIFAAGLPTHSVRGLSPLTSNFSSSATSAAVAS